MISLLKQRKPRKMELNNRSFDAMAIMLLLTQVPHVFYLPIWVSLSGIGLTLLKWRSIRIDKPSALNWILNSRLIILLAITSGVLVRVYYGYFIGRDPCVAFLFLLAACKFAEARKPSDATTLLCLSGFLLLTQYFYSQNMLSAFLTIPSVIALGCALSVLSEQVPRAPTLHRRLVSKLLIQGLPIAALLFILFPRLPGPIWSLPDDASATVGLSDSMSPGEIGNLSQSAEVAFRVEFNGEPPEASDLYWRGPVLSNFDGKNWTVNPWADNGRIESGNVREKISYTVTLEPHNKKWLFALEQAASLPDASASRTAKNGLKATISSDKQISSRSIISKVTRYKQTSLLRDRYTPAKPPGALDLHVPDKNPKTREFAKTLYSKSSSDIGFVNAVLDWFHEQPYSYTLQPTVLGDNPVDEFMFQSQNGFCGHYASAFVVMMRSAGLPSRVVTGYLGGEMNGDYMIVRQSEAHAWAEVYLDGEWVRVDPTAAVAPSRVNLGLAEALPNDSRVPLLAKAGSGWLKRASLRWDSINHGWQRMVVNFNDESQSRFWKNIGMPDPKLWQLTVILLLLAASWCMWVLRPTNLSKVPITEDEKSFRLYCKYLNDAGIKRDPQDTCAQLTKNAIQQLPEHKALLRRIGASLDKLRFENIPTDRSSILRAQLKRDTKKLATIAAREKTKLFAKKTKNKFTAVTS